MRHASKIVSSASFDWSSWRTACAGIGHGFREPKANIRGEVRVRAYLLSWHWRGEGVGIVREPVNKEAGEPVSSLLGNVRILNGGFAHY